jgi:hypothetical protein
MRSAGWHLGAARVADGTLVRGPLPLAVPRRGADLCSPRRLYLLSQKTPASAPDRAMAVVIAAKAAPYFHAKLRRGRALGIDGAGPAGKMSISRMPSARIAPIERECRTSSARLDDASRPASRRRLNSYRPIAANGPTSVFSRRVSAGRQDRRICALLRRACPPWLEDGDGEAAAVAARHCRPATRHSSRGGGSEMRPPKLPELRQHPVAYLDFQNARPINLIASYPKKPIHNAVRTTPDAKPLNTNAL